MNKTLRDRQQEQLERFLAWKQQQGTLELPVRLDTLLSAENQIRIAWLAGRARGRILEVGCNWGYVLARVGGHVGVDINPALIQLASALAPTREFHVADARSLPFPDNSFTTVLLPEVLEHLPWEDVPSALQEAARVGSRLLITVPNGDLETEEAHNFKHRHLMTAGRLSEVVSPFLVVSMQEVGHFYCVEVLV